MKAEDWQIGRIGVFLSILGISHTLQMPQPCYLVLRVQGGLDETEWLIAREGEKVPLAQALVVYSVCFTMCHSAAHQKRV